MVCSDNFFGTVVCNVNIVINNERTGQWMPLCISTLSKSVKGTVYSASECRLNCLLLHFRSIVKNESESQQLYEKICRRRSKFIYKKLYPLTSYPYFLYYFFSVIVLKMRDAVLES
jgi:hypothetical protein